MLKRYYNLGPDFEEPQAKKKQKTSSFNSLSQCIAEFQRVTEEEVIRLIQKEGVSVEAALASLMSQLRSNTPSHGPVQPSEKDLRRVMALGPFSSQEAERILFLHTELTLLGTLGLSGGAAVEELTGRLRKSSLGGKRPGPEEGGPRGPKRVKSVSLCSLPHVEHPLKRPNSLIFEDLSPPSKKLKYPSEMEEQEIVHFEEKQSNDKVFL